VSATLERRLTTWAPPLLVALLTLPFILRQNSWWEWVNSYWLLERQTEFVAAHGTPTLFLHMDPVGFNPYYVYYAGPLLSALAYPAALVGTWPLFVAATIAAIVAGYSGIWWAARNLGLSRRLAILPALAFSTTPYILSNLYGRGAWSEFLAVNTLAVLLGAVTALLWHPQRGRTGALVATVAATAVTAGTHNLTLMLGTLVLPLLLLALLPLRPRSAGPLLPAVGRAVGAAALGAGLTAAWLVPNLIYGRDTWVAQPELNDPLIRQTNFLTSPGNVLSAWPSLPEKYLNRWVYAQPPVAALAWATVVLLALIWLRRRRPDRVTASAAALLALGVTLLMLALNARWWLRFPDVVHSIQYPMRITPYLALVVVMGATVGLAALAGRRRASLWGARILAGLVAFQAAGAIAVVTGSEDGGKFGFAAPRASEVKADEEPAGLSDPRFVSQAQFRVVQRATPDRPVTAQGALTFDDRLTSETGVIDGVAPVGAYVLTPVTWSPFIGVAGGARLAGRDDNGLAIVQVTSTDAAGRWDATVRAERPWPTKLGFAISLLSAALLAAFAVGAVTRRRRGPRPPAPVSTGPPSVIIQTPDRAPTAAG
jgi:hypothetical protein